MRHRASLRHRASSLLSPAIGVGSIAVPHIVQHIMSSEIARVQHMMLFLGSMCAEERLAVFLLDLADRYHRRGFSSTEYILRMTREEIGSQSASNSRPLAGSSRGSMQKG